METKTVLHRLPLYVLVSLAIFMLASCFSSFNSSEEVMAYLEKNYPGQRIVLSDEYETTRGLSNDIRIWTFTLSDYPKDTFHVASYINSYPFPMMKNQHGIIDDFEKVVILRRTKEFEHGPLKNFDALTRRLWTHFPVSDFSLKPARLELRTVDDIWRAKDLIDAFEQFLGEKRLTDEVQYYLRMYMQGPCYDLEHGGSVPPSDNQAIDKSDKKKGCYIERQIYFAVNRQELCQQFYNDVMTFHQLMASYGNGVNKETSQAWAENQLRLVKLLPDLPSEEKRDSLLKLLVVQDDYVSSVFIDTGMKPYMLVTLSKKEESPGSYNLFFTYPQLHAFCLRSGLQVQGTGDHFKVKGVDGIHYEFSAQFYKEKKGAIGFDEDVCYYLRNGNKVLVKNFSSPYECISDALVHRITGRNVKRMVVNGQISLNR